MNNVYLVNDLADIVQALNDYVECSGGESRPLWFRGQAYASYKLIPSLLRANVRNEMNGLGTYNTANLYESSRLQHFKARVFHLTQPKPTNSIEWMALYQHHYGKTRFLDWSESLWTALGFALEAFLDPRPRVDLDEQRAETTPTIWVLDPCKLNQMVYTYFGNKSSVGDYIEKAIGQFAQTRDEMEQLRNTICYNLRDSQVYFHANGLKKNAREEGILNLGVLDDLRHGRIDQLPAMLSRGEFNPFHYLCLRYYADALPVVIKNPEQEILPPLAVLHQYQSERIRSQRGTFTVFPNYQLEDRASEVVNYGSDCRAMEHQKLILNCLMKIRILNPRKVVEEIMRTGIRQTGLYPESDFYARDIEADTFLI